MVRKHAALFVLALGAFAGPAAAGEASKKPAQCFSLGDFGSWKAADARTLYLRVGANSYYRLDLGAPCEALTWPDTHLVTRARGSDRMCSGIDWDLSVADSIGIREACIVKTQTPLSSAEVAVLPKMARP